MRKTLIVVDMQNDFIDGSLGTKEAVAIVPNVKKKIEAYIQNGDEVIFTRDTHHKNYLETNEGKNLPVVHCVEGTDGWKIPTDIDIPECEHIDKPTFGWDCWDIEITDSDGSFHDRHLNEIEIVGLCTDICVVSNALILKSMYPEVKITVDASCCAGATPDKHKAALTVMKCCQINIVGE